MKYGYLPAILIILSVVLTGCFLNQKTSQVNPDGSYLYVNRDLGFSLVLPKTFEYWQVQRNSKEKSVDLEIFVPTGDRNAQTEVNGYAKAAVVRVDEDAKVPLGENFRKLTGGGEKSYSIRFWQTLPFDWKDKWNKTVEENIINSFKLE